MEIDQLRYFLRVARQGNFYTNGRGEKPTIYQSPLCRCVQELDQPVFERRPRSVPLTEGGPALQGRPLKILRIIEGAMAETTDDGL